MLDETIALVKATHSAASFASYVEGDGPASLLAKVELNAAASAFTNLSLSIDRRSQLWNAVNHLESAWHGSLATIREDSKPWKNVVVINRVRQKTLANRAKLIGCILALCYKLLGEHALVAKCVEQLDKLWMVGTWDDPNNPIGPLEAITLFATLWIQMPIAGVAMAIAGENKYITDEHYNQIARILKDRWPEP